MRYEILTAGETAMWWASTYIPTHAHQPTPFLSYVFTALTLTRSPWLPKLCQIAPYPAPTTHSHQHPQPSTVRWQLCKL